MKNIKEFIVGLTYFSILSGLTIFVVNVTKVFN